MSDLEAKAYKLHSIIRVCQFAAENDTCGVDLHERGIAQTLELAASLALELADDAEQATKLAKAAA